MKKKRIIAKIDPVEMMRERYENRLRKVLNIKKHLKYNKDINYGEIGSWILLSIRGIDDAIKLLIEKAISIYIHNVFGSAVFKWNHYEQHFECQLWSNQKLLNEFQSMNIKEVKDKMQKYWRYCRYKEKL